MNNLNTPFFILLIFLIFNKGLSQSASGPWKYSLGLNFIDLYPSADYENAIGNVGPFLNSFFDVNDHWNMGIPTVRLSRYLGYGFSLGIQGSIANIRKIEGLSNTELPYFSSDFFLVYNLLQINKIHPILKLGYGLSQIKQNNSLLNPLLSKNTSKTLFGGVGFDFQLSEVFSIGVEMSYRNAYEKYIPRFFQHSIVMNYAFGKSDLDNDGIPDAKDNCPEEPGLKQFNGCPDSDGDTLPDKDDKCPYIAGNPKLKGCLDSDGDGLIDPEDRCPKRYGSNNMYGCPDTDGDGISDAEDVCMDLIGPIENRGCPWPDSDQDGIPDKDDLCLDEPGLIENNGCPELNNEIMEALNQIASQINFVANSDLIIGQKTRTILDEIIKLLQENPKGKISIEGYASSDGDSNFNKALSIKRAEAVLEYLITGGIEQYRLEIRGYGEEDPISTNQTPEGRAVNRRVQFRAIKEK